MLYFHANFLNCNNYTTHIRAELNTVTDYCDLEKYTFNNYNGIIYNDSNKFIFDKYWNINMILYELYMPMALHKV